MNKLVVSVSEAGDILSIGRSTVYKAIAEQRLERVRIGRRTLERFSPELNQRGFTRPRFSDS